MQTTNSLEFMRKAHRLITKLKYELDHVIEDEKEAIGDFSGPDGARAWVEDGVLRITVDECLPRNATYTNEMRRVWIRKINKALEGVNINFTNALCMIIVYSPHDFGWDVDNRAFKVVPDALRINGIIKNDTYQEITLLVGGETDKEYPRTEIFVVDNPFSEQMIIRKIIEMLKLHIIEEKN
ncbi:MAG: hypothetical protein A4E53_01557 [Pelotomaculum sp. PtaB.Bin104]|nr:MAG: hypothetical protein A4E53_01557 [Pelotomaculum sp. PtaB.Bin104]